MARTRWSAQNMLVALFVIAFIVIQLAVPVLALAQPRPARYGWQMYTAVPSLPRVTVEDADGRTQSVDVTDLVARGRAAADFSAALVDHLCETTDIVAPIMALGDRAYRRIAARQSCNIALRPPGAANAPA